jgi:hypothetical protein
LSLRVKEKGKMIGLEIDAEESYPLTPIKVTLQDVIGITAVLEDAIQESIQSKVAQKGRTKFASITSVVGLVY